MPSAPNSTTSLVSVSLRTPLNVYGSTAAQPKDFESAFASLQSTYGLSGTAPIPVRKKTSSAPRSTAAAGPSPATRTAKSRIKNFQSVFADLQSRYGFGSAVPSPIPKSKKNK